VGFFKRAWDVVQATGGAIEAPFGFVKDLAMEFSGQTDEYDGLIATLKGVAMDRSAQVLENTIGPEGMIGATIGGLPEGVVRRPINNALDALETVAREGVHEPISTFYTASEDVSGHVREEGFLAGNAHWFKGDTWRDAYKTAQDRSPGQAFVIAQGVDNIHDEKAVNEFVGTDFFKISSGLADAYVRMTLDPDVVIGKLGMVARSKYVTKPLSQESEAARIAQLDNYFKKSEGVPENKSWIKTNEILDAIPDAPGRAAVIRDRLFKDHAQGDMISYHISKANGPNEREAAMRFFMGDTNQLDWFRANNEAMASRLQRLFEDQALTRDQMDDFTHANAYFNVANHHTRLSGLKAEIDETVGEFEAAGRQMEGFGSIQNEFRPGMGVKNAITSSGFYQTSPFAKPVRVFGDLAPHRTVDLNRPNASVMVDRMMRQSEMSVERRNVWRSRIDAASPEQRSGLVIQAENESIRNLAKKYGLTKKEADHIIEGARQGRQNAVNHLQQMKFDANEGRAHVIMDDVDGGDIISYPLMVSQTANVLPMADPKAMKQAFREAGMFKARALGEDTGRLSSKFDDSIDAAKAATLRGINLSNEVLTSVMKVWKPTVLLRPAWTIRVVMLDEQFRMLAKFGAMGKGFNMLQGGRNLTHATMNELFGGDIRKATKAGTIGGAVVGGALGGPMGAVAGGAIGGAGLNVLSKVDPALFRQMEMNGYKVQAAFGAPGDQEALYRDLVSAQDSTESMLGVHENGILKQFRADGGYETVRGGQIQYPAAWERVVNREIMSDDMARQFVQGKSEEEVLQWLTGTADGVAHMETLPLRKRNVEKWVGQVKEMVDEVVPEPMRNVLVDTVDDLGETSKARRATYDDLKAVIPDEISKLVNDAFHILGTLPTDHLSRNPAFARFYELDMQRRLGHVSADRIHTDELRQMEKGAREFALKETRSLLYDMAEHSEFSEMVRNLIPFFPAFQEVITRWAGLAVENPVFAARALKVLQSPGKLAKSEDEAIGVFGIKPVWYKNPDGDSFIQFRLPEWAKGLAGHGMLAGGVDSQGYVRFDPKQFSLASGPPGTGPFVQVLASAIVKERPDLEESMKFVLPYGPNAEWLDTFLPAHAKRLQSLSGEDSDRAWGNAYRRIITTRMTEIREGKRKYVDMDDPVQRNKFLKEAKDETNAFFNVRWASSFFSPVSLMFDSPYAPYIDAHRKLKEADPSSADDKFLAEFGEEFFALTQSFTKSNNGIPPTLKGLEVEKKYADLITRYPELGGLISGAEGSGMSDKFSRAAYDRQLQTDTAEGSGLKQRSRYTPVEVTAEPDVRLGWDKFSRAMDAIEAIRIQRNLPNLQVKGAQDLAAAKSAIIATLTDKHPEWAKEYFTTDSRAWKKKIEGLQAIAADSQMRGRPAIAGLSQYLQARTAILAVLASREAKSIGAVSNRDVANAWATITSKLAAEPQFGNLYNRYLENDPMSLDTVDA
jgi:hypothetical protein